MVTEAEKEAKRFYKLTGEGIREAIVVTPLLEVRYGFGAEHQHLAERAGFSQEHPRLLRASYFPQDNVLWFTWPNRPSDIKEEGIFEDHFNLLYDHLSRRYRQFGMQTKVDWGAGVTRLRLLGKELGQSPDLIVTPLRRPGSVRVRPYRRQR